MKVITQPYAGTPATLAAIRKPLEMAGVEFTKLRLVALRPLWRLRDAAAPEAWEAIAGAGKGVGTSAYTLPGAPDLRGVLGETKVITQTRQQRGIG